MMTRSGSFFITALMALMLLFDPTPGRAGSDLKALKSGVWVGAVRADDQGAATSCYLAARKYNKEFWIILQLDGDGLHVLLYNENWHLTVGDTFQSRVVIDKNLFGRIEATIPKKTGIDFLIGGDEPSMNSIQAGRRISFTTPIGKKAFKLQGTRKAVNVLIDCADKYLDAAADTEPHSYQAGAEAFSNKDYKSALGHWLPLAQNGDARSQNAVGILYYNGRGSITKDFIRAAEWFQRAADQDYGRAQNNLGEMYRDGEGVAQDDARAVELFRAAAFNGVDKATENMVAMITSGRSGNHTATGATAEPNLGDVLLAGEWQTSWGKTKITWNGSAYEGSYIADNGNTDDNGTFNLHRQGESLIGIWAESSAHRKCDAKRLGTYYWGRLRLDDRILKSGFTIAWGYCGDGLLESGWDYVAKTGDAAPETAPDAVSDPAQEITSDALIDRAFVLLEGDPTPAQATTARKDVEAAVAKGDRRAMLLLSLMYGNGIGGSADADKSRDYLNQAADALLPDALYRRAILTAETDPEAALYDIRLAASEGFIPALQVYATLDHWETSDTADSIAPSQPPEVAKGDLIAIQAMLNSLGYQAGLPLGNLTEETTTAIKAFQDKEALPVDGFATNELRDQLVNALERGN